MMDLLCGETSPSCESKELFECDDENIGMSKAAFDHNLLSDDRVLQQLLKTENRYIPNGSFSGFKCIQNEVEPHMRKILANWMLEVCEEQACEEIVFPLAMNYVDRVLACTNIRKCQLQLVGAVCLLIASKLRQCNTLHPQVLSYFTDYSVTVQEILGWELLVLSRLKWNVSAVVATDFLDHLLMRLELNNQNNECNLKEKNINAVIRRHASTFIALCATEFQFVSHTPSLIAASSIATAIHGLELEHNPWKSFEKLLNILQKIIRIDATTIQLCVQQIEALIASNTAASLAHQIVASDDTAYDTIEQQLNMRQYIKFDTICDHQIINCNHSSIHYDSTKEIYF